MPYAINTHEYKEAIKTDWRYVKTGTMSILWGMFKFPLGSYIEERAHLLLCERCGEKEFTPIHGHHKLDII